MSSDTVVHKFIAGALSFYTAVCYSFVFERVRVTPIIRKDFRDKSFRQIFNMWRYRGAFANYWNPFTASKMILVVPFGLAFPISDKIEQHFLQYPWLVNYEKQELNMKGRLIAPFISGFCIFYAFSPYDMMKHRAVAS